MLTKVFINVAVCYKDQVGIKMSLQTPALKAKRSVLTTKQFYVQFGYSASETRES